MTATERAFIRLVLDCGLQIARGYTRPRRRWTAWRVAVGRVRTALGHIRKTSGPDA